MLPDVGIPSESYRTPSGFGALRYLPLVMIGQAVIILFHFLDPLLSFCYCLQLQFVVRVPVRTDILLNFQEHDTGYDPAPPVWKTGMQPITPIVRSGREVPDLISPFKVLMYCSFRCYRR